MELIPLTASNRGAWDEFCLKSPDAWFWHTTDWLDYNLAYRLELKPRSLSFLCREGSRVLAVVPLLMTHHEQDGRTWKAFSLSGNFIPSPALDGEFDQAGRDDVLDFIFRAIDDLAEELGVAHSRFRIEALRPAMREPKHAPCNYLLRHDYIDCSLNTQLIDLRLSRNDLREGLSRNHIRSIDRARDLFQIKIHSGSGLTDAKFDEYVAMHARAAGRTTRSLETFGMMRRWIQSGRGLVAEAVANDGKTAGFELYIIYKKGAYGLSACNEPEYKHLPIRHLIEWESMLWMRKHDVEFYEIGGQHFGTLPYDFPEQKNIDISRFKYGFGGVTIPSFYAERFHSAEHWLSEQRLRNERFAKRYQWKSEPRSAEGRALLQRFKTTAGSTETPIPEQPDEPRPLTPELLELATDMLRANPDSAKKCAAGNMRALHFLVGQALRGPGKGMDPDQLRRALEDRLAQINFTAIDILGRQGHNPNISGTE